MDSEQSARPRSARRVVAVGAVVGAMVLCLAGFVWWKAGRDNTPVLASASPFLNVRPGVKYTGDASCRTCHAGYSESYAQHPMGRSLATVAEASPIEKLDPAAHLPFTVDGFKYTVRREGDRVFHTEARVDRQGETIVERTEEIQFAVGSGQHGRSYLIDTEGALRMSPLTWYPEAGIWDLSPGYEKGNKHFNRPVFGQCLFCHANQANEVADTLNRYQTPVFTGHAIGCERCHGPGELHQAKHQTKNAASTGEFDPTIVNPGKLPPALRESVCQQCHLSGKTRILRRDKGQYDYRPGLPLEDFIAVFVENSASEEQRFVGHVEQMQASRCYLESQGQLGCVSCHDPHRLPAPEEKIAWYNGRCQSCHTESSPCTVPLPIPAGQPAAGHCTACHMPAQKTQINHTATTDHRVPRRPALSPGKTTAKHTGLVRFKSGLPGKTNGQEPAMPLEEQRDLGLALVMTAENADEARQATKLLQAAAARHPEDIPAVEGYAFALAMDKRFGESLEVYEKVLATHPEREFALDGAAGSARQLGRLDAAIAFWKRAIAISPTQVRYRISLAKAYVDKQAWEDCLATAQVALTLQPSSPQSRQYLVLACLRLGKIAEAEAAFAVLMRLDPPDPQVLTRWFAEERAKAGGSP